MKQIKEFHIISMTLSGFKCYAQPTELSFGNPTVITGGNGRGKSSIADAITFAITGLPFFGERGIDRLYTDGTAEASVSLRFADQDGVLHELHRSRKKGNMSITYDGYNIRQLDLNDMFGEKDVFLSIFNPLYFIEELGDSGKALLERHLPLISHEAVLAQLHDTVRENLKDEQLTSPDVYLKKRREEIRELEQSIVYLTGQQDLVESQSKGNSEKRNELSEKLSAITAEEEALSVRQFEALDLSAMREELIDFSARYDELAVDSRSVSGADNMLMELNRKLGERKAATYEPKYAVHIAEISSLLKELGTQYKRELEQAKALANGATCPTCKRAVTEKDVPVLKGAFEKSIAVITAQGKEQQAQLAELNELESKAQATFLQFQAEDVAKLEAEIAQMTQPQQADDCDNEAEKLRQAIQALSSDLEYGNLTQEEYDRLLQCREQKQILEAELSTLQSVNDTSAEDYAQKISAIEAQIADKKKRISDVALYVSRRAELTLSALKMNRVAISLYDVVKSTGEIKDAFRFTYDGRRYDRLSLSEKVRAGMEVSELMKRLTGRNYPVFTDNMESVENLANVRPTGQIIMAKCVHNAPLSVKAVGATAHSQAA